MNNNAEGDAIGPVDGVSTDEVVQALNEDKTGKIPVPPDVIGVDYSKLRSKN